MILLKVGHKWNVLGMWDGNERTAIFHALKVGAGRQALVACTCCCSSAGPPVGTRLALGLQELQLPLELCFQFLLALGRWVLGPEERIPASFPVTTSHEVEVVMEKPGFHFIPVGSSSSNCHQLFVLTVGPAGLGSSQVQHQGHSCLCQLPRLCVALMSDSS